MLVLSRPWARDFHPRHLRLRKKSCCQRWDGPSEHRSASGGPILARRAARSGRFQDARRCRTIQARREDDAGPMPFFKRRTAAKMLTLF